MTLRLRLALLITAIAIALFSGGAVLFVHRLNSDLESSLDVTLQSRADVVSSELRGPSVNLDVPNHLRRGEIFLQLLNADGRLLDSSHAAARQSLLSPAQAQVAVRHQIILDRTVVLHRAGHSETEAVRILAEPCRRPDVVIAVAISRDLVDEAGRHATNQLIIAAVLVLLVVFPGAWLLARAALRPVEAMRAEVDRLDAADSLDELDIPAGSDEISRLGATFSRLLGRVHAALARERAFVSDAGHELRTPLAVLKGEFELAQRPGRTREELLQTVSVAAMETDRLISLSENLLGLAREVTPKQQHFDLAAMTGAAVAGIAERAAERNVTIEVDNRTAGLIRGNAERLRQALDNLLTNAVRYIPAGGTLTVRLVRRQADVVIEVADDGPGFPVEFLPVAFDRFTRGQDASRRARDGSGLGLAVVAAIMTAHGGTATAANRPEGGAILTLRWPQPEHRPQPTAQQSRRPQDC